MSGNSDFIILDFVNHNYEVSPLPYNKENIVAGGIRSYEIQREGTTSRQYSYSVKYRMMNGVLVDIYVQAPEQRVFGITPNYVAMKPKVPENFKGYQMTYPMCSLQTFKNKTKAEKAWYQFNDDVWTVIRDFLLEEVEKDVPDLPAPTVNSFMGCMKHKDYRKAIKPIYDFGNVKDSKPPRPDTDKPEKMYIPLHGKVDNKTFEFKNMTDVYTVNGKEFDYRRLIYSEQNKLTWDILPVFKLDDGYLGAHASNPHGASIKYLVKELCVKPVSSNGGVIQKRLGKAPVSTSTEEEGYEPETDDNSSVATPSDLLANLVKSNSAKNPVASTSNETDGMAMDPPEIDEPKQSAPMPRIKTTTKASLKTTVPKTTIPKADPQ